MPLRPVNMSGSDTQFKPIPPNAYLATLTKYEEGVSKGAKTAGQPQFMWTFKIKEGDYEGRGVLYWTRLGDGQNYDLHRLLKASNLYDDKKILSENFKFDPDKLLNIDYVIYVQNYEYNGETRDRINRIEPGDTWSGGDSDW